MMAHLSHFVGGGSSNNNSSGSFRQPLPRNNSQRFTPNNANSSATPSTPSTPLQARSGRRYVPTQILGTGTYGKVYLCHDQLGNDGSTSGGGTPQGGYSGNASFTDPHPPPTPNRLGCKTANLIPPNVQQYAVKVANKEAAYRRSALNESKVLQLLANSKDTVRWVDTYEENGHICIVTELLTKTVYELMKEREFRPMALADVRHVTCNVARSLTALHKCGYMHCDVKPENIMLRSLHEGPASACLIDFGAVRALNENAYFDIQSLWYRAPEVLCSVPYTPKIDSWSLGCLMYELATGKALFPGNSAADELNKIVDMMGSPSFEACSHVATLNYKPGPTRRALRHLDETVFGIHGRTPVTESLVCLLYSLLNPDEKLRIACEEVLAHPFINTGTTNKLASARASSSKAEKAGASSAASPLSGAGTTSSQFSPIASFSTVNGSALPLTGSGPHPPARRGGSPSLSGHNQSGSGPEAVVNQLPTALSPNAHRSAASAGILPHATPVMAVCGGESISPSEDSVGSEGMRSAKSSASVASSSTGRASGKSGPSAPPEVGPLLGPSVATVAHHHHHQHHHPTEQQPSSNLLMYAAVGPQQHYYVGGYANTNTYAYTNSPAMVVGGSDTTNSSGPNSMNMSANNSTANVMLCPPMYQQSVVTTQGGHAAYGAHPPQQQQRNGVMGGVMSSHNNSSNNVAMHSNLTPLLSNAMGGGGGHHGPVGGAPIRYDSNIMAAPSPLMVPANALPMLPPVYTSSMSTTGQAHAATLSHQHGGTHYTMPPPNQNNATTSGVLTYHNGGFATTAGTAYPAPLPVVAPLQQLQAVTSSPAESSSNTCSTTSSNTTPGDSSASCGPPAYHHEASKQEGGQHGDALPRLVQQHHVGGYETMQGMFGAPAAQQQQYYYQQQQQQQQYRNNGGGRANPTMMMGGQQMGGSSNPGAGSYIMPLPVAVPSAGGMGVQMGYYQQQQQWQ